jgi:hypothetical protein
VTRLSFLIACLCPVLLFAQADIGSEITFPEIKISHKTAGDPRLLVDALTAGKTSEREKFDAIFGWVATHLRYNHRQAFSLSGTSYLSPKEILRRRSVVCLGYANLMDSLCALAGITNTTVYGFATDELYDVHDSLFTDNHAWNAVKLDGLWYLYDITWSTGRKEFKLKPFRRLIQRLLLKYPPKFRQKKIRVKLRRRSDCPAEYAGPAYYYKQKFFNRVLRNLLMRFRPRYKRTYVYKVSSDYYLCQPELFSITHCPSNPVWSLGTIRNVHQFENDSAYYYLTDSTYKVQERGGRECAACDSFLELGQKDKIRTVEKWAYQANNRNRFVVAENEHKLGVLSYFDSFGWETDSLKLRGLDSAQLNFLTVRRSLKAQKANNAYEAMLLKRKNKNKMSLLYAENRMHRTLNRKNMRQSISKKQQFRRMQSKVAGFAGAITNWKRSVADMPLAFKTYPARRGSEMKHARKLLKLERMRAEADSLAPQLAALQRSFDSLVQSISLNVWPQAMGYDTLISYFGDRIKLRYQLLDNYKKRVEDMRIKIVNREFNTNNDLDFLLYKPAVGGLKHYKEAEKLIRRRYKLERSCLQLARDLVKVEKMPMSELEEMRGGILKNLHHDYCWLEVGYPFVESVARGFEFLRVQQRVVDQVLPFENWVEKNRAHYVSELIKHRYRKYNNIADRNQGLAARWLRKVKDSRVKILRRRK